MSTAGPPVERELKFAEVELETLREKLLGLEAERLRPATLEDNWVLDKDGELREAGNLLRLRKDGHGARLTFKGPTRIEGRTRVRREEETDVGDAETMLGILESLGFKIARRYQKMREEWQLGGVTISLDRTPIGDFAEFEGEGAETVARRCGLRPEKAERRSYLRLYDDYLEQHPNAPRDMTFS